MISLLLGALALAQEPDPPEAAAPTAPPVDRGRPAEPDVRWRDTIDRVVKSVVSLRVTAVRDFDTEDASVSQGTGFVVDAEEGLLLTNRHMVHAGPVVAEGVFLDHEEVELEPIYRDPVHDFGFYRFDPAAVKHMEVRALELAPGAAQVGVDIRVVGNDAGEKLSILDSTLARLDRNAPLYGSDDYNDFNTFYIQAASNTSGGSSGSPVVDQQGRVVALNAGGATQSASSFYLPLHRVVRALELIREGEPVSRGDIQTTFLHAPFDEVRRLGVDEATEDAVRARGGDLALGMLVVDGVLPEGPAAGLLHPGDVLLRVDGELVTDFVALEEIFDEAVGEPLSIELQRGGERVTVEVVVGDLHAITPDRFLEVGRGIFHPISYMQARNHDLPVRGVYMAVGGYTWSTAGIPEGAVVTDVDGEPTPDLDTFQRVLEARGDGERIRVRYFLVADPRKSYETVAVMDRRWFPMQRCVRDDESGIWPCDDAPAPPPASRPPPAERLPVEADDRVASKLAHSLVMVDFDIPHPTAGVKELNYVGVGTVIDAARGLVLVDRDTVPVALGDMELTFAGTVRLPGRLVYLHPQHDIAVIQYDPTLLGDLEVRPVSFDPSPLAEGDRVWQVGLDGEHALVSQKTRVREIDPLILGQSQTPRFRDTNVTGIWLEEAADSFGGVLVDRSGTVRALWASFQDQATGERAFYGMPLAFVAPTVQRILDGDPPRYRTLGVELAPLPLAEARDRGLSDDRVRQLLDHDPERRHVLEVQRTDGRAPARAVLRDTDLLLAIDGRVVTDPVEIESLQQREKLTLTVFRDEQELEFEVGTFELDGNGVDRVVSWQGLVVHEPHDEVASQQGLEPDGVYVAWLWFGSPGARYGLRPTRRIVQVDDTPTPTLDAFLAAVSDMRHRDSVRLLLEKLDGGELVTTLELDLAYWPTQVMELDDGGWIRKDSAEIAAALHGEDEK